MTGGAKVQLYIFTWPRLQLNDRPFVHLDGVTYSRIWPRKGRKTERRSVYRDEAAILPNCVPSLRGCEVGGGKEISCDNELDHDWKQKDGNSSLSC